MATPTVDDLLAEHLRFGRVAAPGAALEILVPAVRALQDENAQLRRALTQPASPTETTRALRG